MRRIPPSGQRACRQVLGGFLVAGSLSEGVEVELAWRNVNVVLHVAVAEVGVPFLDEQLMAGCLKFGAPSVQVGIEADLGGKSATRP